MSRRLIQHRAYKRPALADTTDALLAGKRKAVDINGKTCSLPMRADTAQRLARALHGKGKP